MEEEKFERCWVCNSLVFKKRIESHHIHGRKEDMELQFPLCIICHDLVDRMTLDNIEVYSEFIGNCIREFEELRLESNGKYKWTKLMILKFNKIYLESLRDNQSNSDNKDIVPNEDIKEEN